MSSLMMAPATVARLRADRIRTGLGAMAPDILAAWEARDDIALGYASWNDYVVGEFGGPLRLGRNERRAVVADMREAGMSTRAIGTALGVDPMTVLRDGAVANATERPDPAPTAGDIDHWHALSEVADHLSTLLLRDPAALAESVPKRRRQATARRLRKLGLGLGRIAWHLEGIEEINDDSTLPN